VSDIELTDVIGRRFCCGDVVMVSVDEPTDLVFMWKTIACPSLGTVLGFHVKVIHMGATHLQMMLTAPCTYKTI
jgi:hypothetical protein